MSLGGENGWVFGEKIGLWHQRNWGIHTFLVSLNPEYGCHITIVVEYIYVNIPMIK